MALTGKTIGELTALDYTTNYLLIPVEEAGTTYHIPFSGINYSQATYSELTIASSTSNLVVGQYYLMTDFQTCYDQPNYTNEGFEITTGNYKTGTTEPILVLATSTTGFSSTAYSILYPKDKISYDFTWSTTEVTNSPAKGRITERIDDRNNRADYDFRAVQFIRYQAFLSENYNNGTVTIDGVGNVVGVGTTFDSDFSVGNIIGIHSPNYGNLIGGFAYYEILTITDATNMTVTGTTFYTESNKFYSSGISGGIRSPFKCNVPTPSYTGSSEYYTFNENDNLNTYLGDNQNYDTFILSNNVFLNGSYQDMTFGGNVVGNTFDNFMTSTTCESFFQFNIITNNFDRSTIGPDFKYNFIECDFQGNTVVANFQYNMLGDNDGFDFDFNQVGWGFRNNFLTMYDDDFIDNIIGNDFSQNLIHYGFSRNIIGDNFNSNILRNTFDENEIGAAFYNNTVRASFNYNKIGSLFNNNNFYCVVLGNIFNNNSFGNTFGDPNSIGSYNFQNNQVGSDLTNNYFSGNTLSNVIGDACQSNNIDTNFSYNQIGSNFQSNTIANDFGFGGGTTRGNVVGNGFASNTIGEYCYDNTFGDNCTSNNISNYFINNKLSHGITLTINNLDSSGYCQNNIFTFGYFSANLTLSGGTGGNPYLYSEYTTQIVKDVTGNTNTYITFLSGGTFSVQNILI